MTRKWIVLGALLLSSPAFADHNIWQDITRQHRSDDILSQAISACEFKVGPDLNGHPTSAAWKQCMRGYGWQLQKTIKEPPEETWTDPDTGDTYHNIKVNGTVIGSSCGNLF